MIFLGELNGLDIWDTGIGNVYLEFNTKEKVCTVADLESGELENHTLVFMKALYGLRSSGLRLYRRFTDTLHHMGFFSSKAEDNIWIRRNGDGYKHIASYVDDVYIVAKEPDKVIQVLEDDYKYKL